MTLKEYVLWLQYPTVRQRVNITIETGKVVDFAVQLEVKVVDKWFAVVRYNYAHGYPHMDMIYADGRRVKNPLQGHLRQIVNYAIKDIREHWKEYLRRCGYSW